MIPQGCRACGANYVAIQPRIKAKEEASKWKILFHQGIFSQLVPGQQVFLLSCILGFHLGTTERHVWFWHFRFCLLQQLEVPEPICLPSLGVKKNWPTCFDFACSFQLLAEVPDAIDPGLPTDCLQWSHYGHHWFRDTSATSKKQHRTDSIVRRGFVGV